MKSVAIVQSNYIPWKGYFDMIAKADVFVIYDEVQYTKNDWRNRNLIATASGLQWITIPVRIERLHQLIYESKIALNNWQKKHKSTLIANYAKAEYFKEYKDQIFSMYEFKSDYLSEVNKFFISSICKLLNINTLLIDSRDLNLEGDKNERLIDACKKLNATNYISGPAARNYLNTEMFTQENIKVDWMDYSGYLKYKQLHQPFEQSVSIIDLIFNTGPNAKNYMKYIK